MFRDKIDLEFTPVNLASLVREDFGQVRLVVPGNFKGNILVGTMEAEHLVEMIKSGSDTVHVRTKDGDIKIDTCSAIKHLHRPSIMESHKDEVDGN